MHQRILRSAAAVSALVVVAAICSPAWSAEKLKQAPTRTYEVSAFKGISVPGSKAGMTVDVFVSDDLARTPRHYLRVGATVKATGPSEVAIILVDVLKREYRGPMVKLTVGKETRISVDVEKTAGRPVSMLRGIRLLHKNKAGGPMNALEKPGDGRLLNNKMVRVSALRLTCADELLPKPDATVTGPRNVESIQKALDSLGPKGGVVYIPAGRYLLTNSNKPIKIPVDNVTVYGDGRATIIEGTWMRAKPIVVATGRKNVRFTRLHFKSLPFTARRGYQGVGKESKYSEPEAKGKLSVTSRGLDLNGCHNVRVDHCEIELFGHVGIAGWSGCRDVLVDHCFFHENFRYGYGYGMYATATIEDNNFENHRHALAAGSSVTYTARFNRFIKNVSIVNTPAWRKMGREGTIWTARSQLRSHDLDHHGGGGTVHAHDNYVSMRNALMHTGVCMRGNSSWIYRNVFENCQAAVHSNARKGTTAWVWGNRFTGCEKEKQGGHFRKKPPDFKEITYPHKMNRFGYWPGTSGKVTFVKSKSDSLCAGPAKPALLREIIKPTGVRLGK